MWLPHKEVHAMSYFGISDFSLISSGLGKRSDGNEGLYSAISGYSQTRAVRNAVTTLNGSALSAKNDKEAGKINDRLSTIMKSMSSQASSATSVADMKTTGGSSRISELAKEAGQKMYEEATGTGKNINTTV